MGRSTCVSLALALLCGCSSPWYSARFAPSPLEVGVTAQGEPRAEARALLAVRGIRRPADGAPARVEVHLRLENLGDVPFALDPEGFDLVTSDLISFRAPEVVPPIGASVEPGAQGLRVLRFATPEGRDVDDLDWSGVNVRFRVLFGERAVITGVTFDRIAVPWAGTYDDPRWGPAPDYGPRVSVGVGVIGG